MKLLISESQLKVISEKVWAKIVKGEGANFDWNRGDIKKLKKKMIPIEMLISNQPIEDEKDKGYMKSVRSIIKKYREGTNVMPLFVHKMKDGNYKIIDGHHRWTALRVLGMKRIRCIIVPNSNVEYTTLNKLNN